MKLAEMMVRLRRKNNKTVITPSGFELV